jgi:hypothetical protein
MDLADQFLQFIYLVFEYLGIICCVDIVHGVNYIKRGRLVCQAES